MKTERSLRRPPGSKRRLRGRPLRLPQVEKTAIANPPDINTAATLLSPMGARHRVPSGRCPHSRRDNVLTCGGGAARGRGSRGAGQFPNIGRTCGDTDQGHGAVTPSRHTGCLVADYHRLSSLLILLQLARFISL